MKLDKAQCLNGWLHDYIIVDQNHDGVHEVCRRCNNQKFFRTAYEKVDNDEYLAYHVKQALPPEHPSFYREFFYLREELNNFI